MWTRTHPWPLTGGELGERARRSAPLPGRGWVLCPDRRVVELIFHPGATDCWAKILREKPIWPMGVPFRALVSPDEQRKAAGFGGRCARFPPLFQNRTLHQAIRPADDGQRAEHALA